MKHLLSIEDLDRSAIEEMLDQSDAFVDVLAREIPKVPALRGKTVVSLFYEDSTRTRLSFETAAKRLSADTMSFTVGSSSVKKGESLDTTMGMTPLDGLCMGTRGPIVSSICARHFAGPKVATIYGTIYASNALGAAFGSLMGGVLHDVSGGYVVGLCFSLAFIVLAAMPFWVVPALRNYR